MASISATWRGYSKEKDLSDASEAIASLVKLWHWAEARDHIGFLIPEQIGGDENTIDKTTGLKLIRGGHVNANDGPPFIQIYNPHRT